MYLKDLSPYLRQFLPYSNSQNTIRINLLGNPTPLVIIMLLTILYLYTQPINAFTVVLLLGVVTQSVKDFIIVIDLEPFKKNPYRAY